MTQSSSGSGDSHVPFLTHDDEMSLAEAQAGQDGTAVPDSLEVHSDAMSVMQDSVIPLRRPILIAVAVLGIAVVAIIGSGLLGRILQRGAALPSA